MSFFLKTFATLAPFGYFSQLRKWRALKNKTFKRVFFRKTFMPNFIRFNERYIRLFTIYIRLFSCFIRLIPRYIRLFHKLNTNRTFPKKLCAFLWSLCAEFGSVCAYFRHLCVKKANYCAIFTIPPLIIQLQLPLTHQRAEGQSPGALML
jgi:hypothetical protein